MLIKEGLHLLQAFREHIQYYHIQINPKQLEMYNSFNQDRTIQGLFSHEYQIVDHIAGTLMIAILPFQSNVCVSRLSAVVTKKVASEK